MPYVVFENESSVDINLLLNPANCRPITIIANPQEQSPPSATGNVTAYLLLTYNVL